LKGKLGNGVCVCNTVHTTSERGVSSIIFVVYFLVFSVCEGWLGLYILVSIIRSHGNDYFQSYSVLQC
jgi:hypothetical protein